MTTRPLLPILLAAAGAAADGPGLPAITFAASEVGTVLHVFPVAEVGMQVTCAELQHGYLYLSSSLDVDGTTFRGVHTWWDISDPRRPVLVRRVRQYQDKMHSIGFWQGYGLLRTNGLNDLEVWDFRTMTRQGSVDGASYAIWTSVQAPWIYRGSSAYTAHPGRLQVVSVATPTSPATVATIDVEATLGWKPGSVHALGNLLVVSASETSGAAVFDIGDPLAPRLLSAVSSGHRTYTSLIHGSRLYACGNDGMSIYDFADPHDIRLIAQNTHRVQYIAFKDGIGYATTEQGPTIAIDAATLATTVERSGPSGNEFVYPMGNLMVECWQGARLRVRQAAPDRSGPVVVHAHPARGATGLRATSRFGFSLSDQIDVRSLAADSFSVRPLGGTPLAGTWSTQMGVVHFAPAAGLSPDTTYKIELRAGGIRDVVGNGLASAWVGRVATGSTVIPNAPPTVALTAPAGGASAPGDLALAATAADGDGRITKVEFWRGATRIATDATAPYAATWTGATAGTVVLTARAFDDEGGVTTSAPVTVTIAATPDTTAPILSDVRVLLAGRVPPGTATVAVVGTATTVTPAPDGSFSVPISVPAGMSEVVLRWQDAAGTHQRTVAVGPAPTAGG